ncbi:hypothetical protein D3C71_2190820 [compost metagenome]
MSPKLVPVAEEKMMAASGVSFVVRMAMARPPSEPPKRIRRPGMGPRAARTLS